MRSISEPSACFLRYGAAGPKFGALQDGHRPKVWACFELCQRRRRTPHTIASKDGKAALRGGLSAEEGNQCVRKLPLISTRKGRVRELRGCVD